MKGRFLEGGNSLRKRRAVALNRSLRKVGEKTQRKGGRREREQQRGANLLKKKKKKLERIPIVSSAQKKGHQQVKLVNVLGRLP